MSDFDTDVDAVNPTDEGAADTPSPAATAVAPPAPDASSLPSTQVDPSTTGNISAATDPATGPQKPSLWKSILMGALSGMAAGSQVNTRGQRGPGGAIAGGLASGASAALAAPMKQQAAATQLDMEKAQTAFHYANLSLLHKQIAAMPDDKQEALLDSEADQTNNFFKSGAATPLSPATDYVSAMKDFTARHAANPWAVYNVLPTRGADGKMAYTVVQFSHAPLQQDLTIKGGGLNGEDITVPSGTPADKAGQYYTAITAKKIQAQSQSNLEGQKNQDKLGQQDNAEANAEQLVGVKANLKGAGGSGKVDRNLYEGTDAKGNQVAGTSDELTAAGIRNYAKMPALTQTQTLAAREMTAPDGLFATARQQVLSLQKAGKLGPVASRWNNFWASKGLDGDQQAFRGTMGLIATKLMQAHMGNRGGKDAMQHFADLVPENSTPDALMKELNNEYVYVNALAKRPKAVTNGQQ